MNTTIFKVQDNQKLAQKFLQTSLIYSCVYIQIPILFVFSTKINKFTVTGSLYFI